MIIWEIKWQQKICWHLFKMGICIFISVLYIRMSSGDNNFFSKWLTIHWLRQLLCQNFNSYNSSIIINQCIIKFYQWAINNFPLNFNKKNEELSGIISTISSIVVHVFDGKFVGVFFPIPTQVNPKKKKKSNCVLYFQWVYVFV